MGRKNKNKTRVGGTSPAAATEQASRPAPSSPPVVRFAEVQDGLAPSAPAAPPASPAGNYRVVTSPAEDFETPPRQPAPAPEPAAPRRGGQFSARRVVLRNKFNRNLGDREIFCPMMPPDAYRDKMIKGDEVINGERRPGRPLGQEVAFDSEDERDAALAAHGWRRKDPLAKNDLDVTKPPTI